MNTQQLARNIMEVLSEHGVYPDAEDDATELRLAIEREAAALLREQEKGAQAVAVGAIREVIELLRVWPSATNRNMADKLTRAISGEKAGRVDVDWTADARKWGGALNNACLAFLEVCPEKSTLLFNNCKPALRAAILKYAERVAVHAFTLPDKQP